MSNLPQLNPTLWRTCRVLSGRTRLKLLRLLHDEPGQCVSDLAKQIAVGISHASQELRRIQSRGLLRPEHKGVRLVYRMQTDPQVASAPPLLQALKNVFTRFPPDQDSVMVPIATGLAHARRIAIVKALLQTPCSSQNLQLATRIPPGPLSHHLQILETSGWVQRNRRIWIPRIPAHPLGRALAKLLQPA